MATRQLYKANISLTQGQGSATADAYYVILPVWDDNEAKKVIQKNLKGSGSVKINHLQKIGNCIVPEIPEIKNPYGS